jgi:hypothetical protein
MLTKTDLEMFGHFGISAELVGAAGVRRVTDAEARHDGFSLAAHTWADSAESFSPT